MQTLTFWKNVANRGRNMIFRDKELSPGAGASPVSEMIPSLAMLCDPQVAFQFFEDFLGMPMDDTTANPTTWKYSSDTATGGVTLPSGVVGGVINVACGGTDNNETYIQLGPLGTMEPFKILDASDHPLWFECRAKALEHADEGVFIGLAEAGCAAANFLADNTGAVADKDFIGFNILAATPEAWNTTWKKAGQTVATNAGEAGVNADDWHVFGFYFDGESTVTFFADGVACTTTATTSAATFPSGEELGPIVAVKTGEAVAKNVQVDYIRVVQAR